MRYFKVDTEQKAKDLSELIYKVMNPNASKDSDTKYLFDWIAYEDYWLLCIPEKYKCPVFQNQDFDTIIAQIGQILGTALASREGANLTAYLKTGSIILENIIPSGLEEITPIFKTSL